jgi:fluoride exporter
MPYLIVFLGAGVGGVARHGVNIAAARMLGYGFPFGTLIVNVLGSVVMGLLTELFVVRSGLPQELRLFMTTGVLGGFTTFSTFSLDTVTLWERGHWVLRLAMSPPLWSFRRSASSLDCPSYASLPTGTDNEVTVHELAVLGASLGGICCSHRDLRQGRRRECQFRLRHLLPYHRYPDGGRPDALHYGRLAGTVLGFPAKLALSRSIGARHGRILDLLFPGTEAGRCGPRRPHRQALRRLRLGLRRLVSRRAPIASELARCRHDRGRSRARRIPCVRSILWSGGAGYAGGASMAGVVCVVSGEACR